MLAWLKRCLPLIMCLGIGLMATACFGTSQPINSPGPTLVAIQAIATATVASSAPAGTANDLPIFDTHVHYSQNAWPTWAPSEILIKLSRAAVTRALVSSSPDDGTRKLYDLAPDRVVPILRPYFDDVSTGNWFEQDKVRAYLAGRLQTPIYKGIGEMHLSVGFVNTPVVRETVRMALERDIFLHVHSDAQTVRALFDSAPQAKILWAHAGLSESPETIAQMMDDHANLWADTAIREWEIAPNGQLSPAWRALFLKHSDHFTIGSDTWIPSRWDSYENIIAQHRRYLSQLPREVAEKIAYRNAARLFGAGTQ